jgi:hypothetical protein
MSGNAPKPLLQPENLDRFDPLMMSHWTLPMVLTWIIWRDIDRVRSQYERYDWYLRDANRSKDPADETVARLPPTRLKHLADVILETEDPDLPQTFIVRGPAARDNLWLKLGSATIIATGIPVGGAAAAPSTAPNGWISIPSIPTDLTADGRSMQSAQVTVTGSVSSRCVSHPNLLWRPGLEWMRGALQRRRSQRGDALFMIGKRRNSFCTNSWTKRATTPRKARPTAGAGRLMPRGPWPNI